MRIVRALLGLALAGSALVGGTLGWAWYQVRTLLDTPVAVHAIDLPVPTGLGEEGDPRDQARARGEHLVKARVYCTWCHGPDLGGGTMLEDPVMGALFGPNLTTGRGGVGADYTPADWERAVRHGVGRDGTPLIMPNEFAAHVSDAEMSDLVAYLQSVPPVDRQMPASSPGPMLLVLLATGQFPLPAVAIEDHLAPHAAAPPRDEATPEFGRHLTVACQGCHGHDFAGGHRDGDPAWPPAQNLTPHADGIGTWTFETFRGVMRDGRRPDGAPLIEPMDKLLPYTQQLTDTELEAMWAWLQSLPPTPTPE